jgi:hypothetical protein
MRLLPILFFLSLQLPGQACIQFARFKVSGSLPVILSPQIMHEVSGMEASRINPGILWAHDDANNSNEVIAMSASGQIVQRYAIGNLINGDWEDMAIGPGPEKGRDYIYIADIGNNDLKYSIFSLIRFPEPITPETPQTRIQILNYEIFSFRYPSTTHDAETLMIDPIDGVPYILTKEKKSSGYGYLYSYPLPLDPSNIKTLQLASRFNHAAPKFSAGDVSQDGRWVVVRNDDIFYTYLRGDSTNAFGSAFTNTVCLYDASNQGNAEALTLITDAQGTRVYCTSEGTASTIWESHGKLPPGTVSIPAWWNFGSGIASWLWGHPGLTLDNAPVVGRTISVELWSARPTAPAALAFGLTAIPDQVVPLGQGWAHVSPVLLMMMVTTTNGTSQLPLGVVPNTPSVLGVTLHAQGVVDDPAAPSRMALTRGLSLQVGR